MPVPWDILILACRSHVQWKFESMPMKVFIAICAHLLDF